MSARRSGGSPRGPGHSQPQIKDDRHPQEALEVDAHVRQGLPLE